MSRETYKNMFCDCRSLTEQEMKDAIKAMSKEKQTGFSISKGSVDKLFPKKDIDILGYESPIKIVIGQMRMEQENNIYRAIQEYGVDVDKDELVKALHYDRNQYEKGYVNGYNRRTSEVAEEIFAELLNEIDKAIDFTADSRRIRFELCQQKEIDPYKDRFFNVCDGKYNCVLGFGKYVAELKKKYTEN